jgi:hypothetical protein
VRDYVESLGVTRPPFPGLTGPVSFHYHRRVGLTLRMTNLSVMP